MKTCRTCGQEKGLDDFHRNKARGDGHCSICKKCACLRANLHRKLHPEVYLRIERERHNRPDRRTQRAQISLRYYRANKELCDKRARLCRERNLEAYRAREAKKSAKWRAENPERAAASWRKSRHKRRAALSGSSPDANLAIEKILKNRKRHCFYCGVRLTRKNLHVDHMSPLAKGGAHSAANLVAACDKCNLSKHDKSPNACKFIKQLVLL